MGVSYNPRIVTDGLVLCLDAANTKSYPGSGTTWTDLSGNRNNGTLTNGPTYSGDNGGSIVFDGNNDYVVISNLNNLNTQYASSEVWVKLDSPNNGAVERIFERVNRSGGFVVTTVSITKTNTNKFTVRTRNNLGSSLITELNTLPSTNWVQLVHTYDGTTVCAYVNGVLDISSNSLSGPLNTGSDLGVLICSNAIAPGTQTMDGNIGAVKIYNRALTASEIPKTSDGTGFYYHGWY